MLCDDTLQCVLATLPLHVLQYVKRVSRQFRRCARNTIHGDWLENCDGEINFRVVPNLAAMWHAVETNWVLCRLPCNVEIKWNNGNGKVEAVLHDLQLISTDVLFDRPLDFDQKVSVNTFSLEIPGVGMFSSVEQVVHVLGMDAQWKTHYDFLTHTTPYLIVGRRNFPFCPKPEIEPFCDLYTGAVSMRPAVIVRPDGSAVRCPRKYELAT